MNNLLAIVGPTASGKTEWGLKLARECRGEIISADSRQVYKELSVGTSKPEGEWVSSFEFRVSRATADETPPLHSGSKHETRNRHTSKRSDGCLADPKLYVVQGIPYHLVDIWPPNEPFTAAEFVRLATEKIQEIQSRGKQPILVGGTGLYMKALTEGLAPLPPRDESLRQELHQRAQDYGREHLHAELSRVDPEAALKIPAENIQRVIRALEVFHLTGKPISVWHQEHQKNKLVEPFKPLQEGNPIELSGRLKAIAYYGIEWEREELIQRIETRCHWMWENGIIKETQHLLDQGYKPTCPALTGLGYPRVIAYLQKKLSASEALHLLIQDTRQYAKRQGTWFCHQANVTWRTFDQAMTQLPPLQES